MYSGIRPYFVTQDIQISASVLCYSHHSLICGGSFGCHFLFITVKVHLTSMSEAFSTQFLKEKSDLKFM